MHTITYKAMFPFALSFLFFRVSAQQIPIGQACPDIVFSNVLNTTPSSIRLSQFRGKLVILDFWATTCTSCIHEFDKTDSLQKLFKDKVQFLLVTKESKETVANFFQKRKKIKMPDVPFITGDSTLSEYFPYTFMPHHVWIDKEGNVHAITYGNNARHVQIKNYLEGKKITPAVKKDSLLRNYESTDFGLAELADERNQLVYYSYLTGYIQGVTLLKEQEVQQVVKQATKYMRKMLLP